MVVFVILVIVLFFVCITQTGQELWHSLRCGGKTYTHKYGNSLFGTCTKCKKTVLRANLEEPSKGSGSGGVQMKKKYHAIICRDFYFEDAIEAESQEEAEKIALERSLSAAPGHVTYQEVRLKEIVEETQGNVMSNKIISTEYNAKIIRGMLESAPGFKATKATNQINKGRAKNIVAYLAQKREFQLNTRITSKLAESELKGHTLNRQSEDLLEQGFEVNKKKAVEDMVEIVKTIFYAGKHKRDLTLFWERDEELVVDYFEEAYKIFRR